MQLVSISFETMTFEEKSNEIMSLPNQAQYF